MSGAGSHSASPLATAPGRPALRIATATAWTTSSTSNRRCPPGVVSNGRMWSRAYLRTVAGLTCRASAARVAEALHVRPATVRKYARDHILPFDTTPGGHRRFDVDEVVQAVAVAMRRAGRPGAVASGEAEWEPAPDIPYVRVEPA